MCHYATFFSMRALLNLCETLWKQKKEYLSGVQYREVMRRTASPDLLGDSRFCACPLRFRKRCARTPRWPSYAYLGTGWYWLLLARYWLVLITPRPRPRLRLGRGLERPVTIAVVIAIVIAIAITMCSSPFRFSHTLSRSNDALISILMCHIVRGCGSR